MRNQFREPENHDFLFTKTGKTGESETQKTLSLIQRLSNLNVDEY